MMRSAIEGAVAGGGHAAAIRIGREAGQGLDGQAQPSTARVADYLPPGHAYVCKYMPSRKVRPLLAEILLKGFEWNCRLHMHMPLH